MIYLLNGAIDCSTFLIENIFPVIHQKKNKNTNYIFDLFHWLPNSEAGIIFEAMVRHMGPPMERKTPKATDKYMCQGNTAKPLAKLLNTSENKDSKASVTTERRNTYKYINSCY